MAKSRIIFKNFGENLPGKPYLNRHAQDHRQVLPTAQSKVYGESIERPTIEQLADLNDEEHMNLNRDSFYSYGRKMYDLLKKEADIKNVRMYVGEGDDSLVVVTAGCGHTTKNGDKHRTCKACTLCILGYVCEKCWICNLMDPTIVSNRARLNVGDSKGCPMRTLGQKRWEARHLLERMYFVEGMLWYLVRRVNVERNYRALLQIRKNIEFLRGIHDHTLTHDIDRNEFDQPKAYDEEETAQKQPFSRDAWARKKKNEAAHQVLPIKAALAYIKGRLARPEGDRCGAPGSLPLKLPLKDSLLKSTFPEFYNARCRGYDALRFNYTAGVYMVTVPVNERPPWTNPILAGHLNRRSHETRAKNERLAEEARQRPPVTSQSDTDSGPSARKARDEKASKKKKFSKKRSKKDSKRKTKKDSRKRSKRTPPRRRSKRSKKKPCKETTSAESSGSSECSYSDGDSGDDGDGGSGSKKHIASSSKKGSSRKRQRERERERDRSPEPRTKRGREASPDRYDDDDGDDLLIRKEAGPEEERYYGGENEAPDEIRENAYDEYDAEPVASRYAPSATISAARFDPHVVENDEFARKKC